MGMRLFNSLTRQEEDFAPQGDRVRMYTCGLTVYNRGHIGNFRTFVCLDVLRRTLEHVCGWPVRQVMNFTDVDDRTIAGAQKAGMPLREYTDRFIAAFREDASSLGLEPVEENPRATDEANLQAMADLVKALERNGHTYRSDGSIYYRIDRFPDYGKLAHLDADALQSRTSGRVDSDEYAKDDVRDFALWKAWTPEDGAVYWETELGKGRPGWHIECSAMAMKYLGKHFDMHTGGEDNIFPHHENEIAQSEAATGEPFVNYWLHCRHLLVDNLKMSKSLGNFYTLRDLLEQGFKPKGIRYALLSIHYRQPLNFTVEGLHAADQAVQRLIDFMQRLQTAQGEGFAVQPLLAETQQRFEEALDDDLNISGALGAIFEMVREVNRAIAQHQLRAAEAEHVTTFMYRLDTVLGLLSAEQTPLDREVENLMEERQQARQARDFARADALRAQLRERGYVVEDTPQGPRLKRL